MSSVNNSPFAVVTSTCSTPSWLRRFATFAPGSRGGANKRDGMMEHLHAPIPYCRRCRASDHPVRSDVISEVAIDTLIQALNVELASRNCALRTCFTRMRSLPTSIARRYSVTFQFGNGLSVVTFCPRFGRVALAFKRQRLDLLNARFPAKRLGSIVDDLLFRRSARARNKKCSGHNCEKRLFHAPNYASKRQLHENRIDPSIELKSDALKNAGVLEP